MSKHQLVRSISEAVENVGRRHFSALQDTMRRSEDLFWFTRNDGNLDVPEKNLTWRVAQSIEKEGFTPLFEVGTLTRKGSIDLVGVDWKQGVTLLCEAKLLYSGGKNARRLREDIDRMVKIEPGMLARLGLPRRAVRMVVATTWTFDPRVPKRDEVVARWRKAATRPRGQSEDRELQQLLRRLDRFGATFISRPSGWFKDDERRCRQHVLAAIW